jgi:hypothetical protein
VRFEGDVAPPPQSKGFRVGTFTGAWPIESSKTVTLRGSLQTMTAINVFNFIVDTPEPRNCGVAFYNGEWYLVAVGC